MAASTAVFVTHGDRLQEQITVLLDEMTSRGRSPAQQVRLQAVADQLSAALRDLHASTTAAERAHAHQRTNARQIAHRPDLLGQPEPQSPS